jgi:hypothetical protein
VRRNRHIRAVLREGWWVLLLTLGAVGGAASIAVAGEGSHAMWNPTKTDAVRDAIGVWKYGASYFPDTPDALMPKKRSFDRMEAWVRYYLSEARHERIPVGCAIAGDYRGSLLREALVSGDSDRELQALSVLMKSKTSTSVSDQYRVLMELSEEEFGRDGNALLRDLKKQFEVDQLSKELQQSAEAAWSASDATVWALAAVGATGHVSLLGYLEDAGLRGGAQVQVYACTAIKALPGLEATKALTRLSVARANTAGELAASILAQRAPEVLRRARRKDDLAAEVRDVILRNLVRIGDIDSVSELCMRLPYMASWDRMTTLVALREIATDRKAYAIIDQSAAALAPGSERSALRDILRSFSDGRGK